MHNQVTPVQFVGAFLVISVCIYFLIYLRKHGTVGLRTPVEHSDSDDCSDAYHCNVGIRYDQQRVAHKYADQQLHSLADVAVEFGVDLDEPDEQRDFDSEFAVIIDDEYNAVDYTRLVSPPDPE